MLAGGWLVLMMWCLAGAVLAVAFRNVALPIGLGVVWILGIETLLAGVVSSLLPDLEFLSNALPGTNAGSLVFSVTGMAAADAPPGVRDAVGGGRALLTLLGYCAIFAVLAAWTQPPPRRHLIPAWTRASSQNIAFAQENHSRVKYVGSSTVERLVHLAGAAGGVAEELQQPLALVRRRTRQSLHSKGDRPHVVRRRVRAADAGGVRTAVVERVLRAQQQPHESPGTSDRRRRRTRSAGCDSRLGMLASSISSALPAPSTS